MIEPGQLVLVISPTGKRFMQVLDPAKEIHTHDGRILMSDIAEAGFGGIVRSHLGHPYRVLKPTVYELIKGVKRQTQIMYPKEIGYLLLKLGITPGCRVIETGTGSGGLTLALATYVGDSGMVYTYERREEFYKNAAKNLARVGLSHRVTQHLADIEETGFEQTEADALFLDVRVPQDVLHHIPPAVRPGAMCGFLLPTCNQVSDLLRGLEDGPFTEIEALEILVRRYKTVPDRLRPEDRMVAHTGFLVFARCMEKPAPFTRPAKVQAAEDDPEFGPETDGDASAEEPGDAVE
ncbi:tRNA (adenine57-N1/adenine58-N1)-methyltransferase [Humidesulfovibrio mexicanus]|uniref:tRNA (adenine(58)-N(1))-methyltransferase TrmI n=1 Tax=Humidesulfovibrio mexicanus TaxID=147047 RepID=A0A238ZTI9_9BACT|nr:tRNA (adenine-N1)-methyltransferase [Humidesulfovibrio mexicanus]SNR86064.1 tRNA (adenine57-N1/adenine58-N1)-methyltransferase [Humidesulfovibrio mexicanus]